MGVCVGGGKVQSAQSWNKVNLLQTGGINFEVTVFACSLLQPAGQRSVLQLQYPKGVQEKNLLFFVSQFSVHHGDRQLPKFSLKILFSLSLKAYFSFWPEESVTVKVPCYGTPPEHHPLKYGNKRS